MAFTSSGHELWVGSGQQYSTLKSAIAASKSGDTIYVKAGTYENDFSAIRHDLQIVGLDGKAHLKNTASGISNGKGILVVQNNADVVIDNLEFSGAKVSDRNGAGIRLDSGSLVIKNSHFHDNQMHILAAHDSDATVRISGSEFGATTPTSTLTHGVYIGRIADFEITDSYLHDTRNGHHLKSRAKDNLIEDNRILDASSDTSHYSIDLPEGNKAVIRGNVLEQSDGASNRSMIHYGGEKSSYTGSLLVADNEFINNGGNAIGVLNHTPITVKIDGNVFHNVSKIASGSHTKSNNTIYDDLDHVGEPAPSPTPEPTPEPNPGTDPDASAFNLLVRASGDAYNGDPQFRLFADGQQIGATTTVTADHADGEWQTFEFSGNAGADGLGEVVIQYINDASGGSADKDRNLYIDRIEIDGTQLQAEDATYIRPNGKTYTDREKMSWTGKMVFDTDDVQVLGVAASSSTDDGMTA